MALATRRVQWTSFFKASKVLFSLINWAFRYPRVQRANPGISMHPQPLVVVRDVEASSRWYQAVLACESGHGGPEYERLVFDGRMILQLHHWDAHEHPHLGDRDTPPYGNGVLLWFQTDDFDAAVARVMSLGAEVLEGPKVNPNAKHREIWLRDPDGYKVVLAGAYGDLGTDQPE